MVLVAMFGLGTAVTAGFVLNDLEGRRPGAILKGLLWMLAVLTCLEAVLYRAAPNSGPHVLIYQVGSVAAPVFLLLGALLTWRHRQPGARYTLLAPLLAYAAVQLVSAGVNGQLTSLSPVKVGTLLYLPTLAVLVTYTAIARDEILGLVRRICLTIAYASLAYLLVATEPAAVHLPRRLPAFGLTERIAGITPHPNLLAFVAALGALIAIAQKARLRWVHLLAAVACIGVAEARNVAITFALALTAIWLSGGRSPIQRILVGVPAATAAAIYLANGPVAEVLGDSKLTTDVDNFNDRTAIWDLAFRYVPERILLGWGPFAFDKQVPTPFSLTYFNNAHNQLIQAAIDGGALGVAAFLAVLLAMLRVTLRRPLQPLMLGIGVLTLMFMLTEVPLTAHIYGFNFVVLVLALVLAVFAAHDRASDDEDRPAETSVLPGRPTTRP